MEVSLTPDGARMPGCWDVRPQGSGDLGERMARALDLAGHTLVIGSDIPGLTRQHIGRAFNRLKAAPVVLGPATDGGYWAIGQRARGRLKLAPIRWSGPHALADTIQALGKKHYALADMMQDVDDGAALAGLGFR